jgi:hypothetical protein
MTILDDICCIEWLNEFDNNWLLIFNIYLLRRRPYANGDINIDIHAHDEEDLRLD